MGNNFYYIDIVDDHGDDDYVQQQPAGGGPDEVVGALSQCTQSQRLEETETDSLRDNEETPTSESTGAIQMTLRYVLHGHHGNNCNKI